MDLSCYVCGHLIWSRRQGQLRDAPAVGVFECQGCGLVTPGDLDSLVIDYEAGSMHGGALIDIQEWREECLADDLRRLESVLALLDGESAVLDVGCGAGGFMIALEQTGIRAYGLEPETTARDFLREEGFRVFKNISEISESDRSSIGAVTAFHVLEHIADPRGFIENLVALLPNTRRFIFEVPCSEDALLAAYQCEEFSKFTYWSHHVHLHSLLSLELLLKGRFASVEVSRLQRYSLANHVGWLNDGQPGGQSRFPWLDNTSADRAYRSQLITQGYSDSLWAVATTD